MIVTLSNNISNLNNAIRNRSLKVNLVKNNLTLNLINLLKERRIIVNFKELDHRYVTVLLKKGLSFKIRMLTKPSRYIYMGYKELNTKSFGNGC